MEYMQALCPVISKKVIAKNIFDFTIKSKEVVDVAKAGQFVHILAKGHTLRRPISIADINKENSTLRVVFEVRGNGTKEIANVNEGENLDILAPLGRGFTLLDKDKKVILIGGGIGTPPMLPLAKYYGENATVISGFRTSSIAILGEEFDKCAGKNILCTDDGSAGVKGFVTTALEEILATEKPDMIYTCGPTPMLRAIAKIAEEKGVNCEVSLEERMGCGVGACLVCACKTRKNDKEIMSHVCKDGPVYNSLEVVW